MLFVEKMRTSD